MAFKAECDAAPSQVLDFLRCVILTVPPRLRGCAGLLKCRIPAVLLPFWIRQKVREVTELRWDQIDIEVLRRSLTFALCPRGSATKEDYNNSCTNVCVCLFLKTFPGERFVDMSYRFFACYLSTGCQLRVMQSDMPKPPSCRCCIIKRDE